MLEIGFQGVDVRAVAQRHELLRELAGQTAEHDIQAILNLAAAVLLHGQLEPAHMAPILRFVDPAVLRELATDHMQLDKEVEYLRELHRLDPDAPDVMVLAASILRRLRQHVARDDRILYKPMERLIDLQSS